MGLAEHKQDARKTVRCRVITVSDTRDETTDKSGKLMMDLLAADGHSISGYEIVKDVQEEIKASILKGCDDPGTDVILTNGGTGIAKRDVTIETVQEIMDKEIPGFGELFRMLSYQEDIGPAAILSRAISAVARDKAIFSVPGSSGAVSLAMKKLILPELGHVVKEMNKDL
ncbi:MogA/MoaB family molybdenum cofactor biosynthesis protein [Peribacillus sp. B-H-3]|jgi:molybdopterin adenylyltransferase|uniref:MogA/MoaB family molybdenum cofactor biosynthesis protein n=1 Tax=Peribacillus sp. B-H-3 TaxID=3400420 RepID=UPI003B010BCB